MTGTDLRVAIIGAGIAGLACARRLVTAGVTPVVFDKGRGIGGRVATRRTDAGLRFDHGAQYVTARDPAFVDVLAELERDGFVARWESGGATPRFVGLPGMSGLARGLAAGILVRSAVQVSGIVAQGDGWEIVLPQEQSAYFDRVVVTTPAPQAAALLPKAHPLVPRIKQARLDPCLTLMAAFPPEAPRPFLASADDSAELAWIAQDSSKPGRTTAGPTTWIAQAASDWSLRHLEETPESIAARMLPLLAARIGANPADALYSVAHRWRYARVARALGAPFLHDREGRLFVGGDWCLGPRVEAAWQSGDAIGAAILSGA